MSGRCRCSVCRAVNGACWRRESRATTSQPVISLRPDRDGNVVAVPFDLTRLQVGATAPVAAAEGILGARRGAQYTWSGNGLLAYVAGRAEIDDRTLVWVDRHGKAEPAECTTSCPTRYRGYRQMVCKWRS